jgi:aminoglycoside 6'-N-acetyltransferase I
MTTRLLTPGEKLPYDLLLLADELVEVIDQYIFDCEVYVYEEDRQIIGVYALYKINRDEVEIKNIAVRTDHQGKGIGKKLLQDADQKARARGFQTIWVGTGDVMMMQLYFYQKAGFEMSSLKKNFYLINYPAPLYENGLQLKHMVMLTKALVKAHAPVAVSLL